MLRMLKFSAKCLRLRNVLRSENVLRLQNVPEVNPIYGTFTKSSNMNSTYQATSEITGISNPAKKEEKRDCQEEKRAKPQYRYLTEEMFEKYWKMRLEEDMFKKRYEMAAYIVYGTVPSGKTIAEKESLKTKGVIDLSLNGAITCVSRAGITDN